MVGRLVLYGYQGANTDAEQLAFDQLFDAALGELSVVARRRDFGWALGLTWRLLGLWLVVRSLLLLVSVRGVLVVAIVVIHGWLPSCCCCCVLLHGSS